MTTRRLKLVHASMEFGDPTRQQRSDVARIIGRDADIYTGTEAGPGSGELPSILRTLFTAAGYHFYVPKQPTDAWVAVVDDLITGGWATHYQPVLQGAKKSGSTLHYGPKGITWVEFDTADLGHISVGASHYLVGGRRPGRVSQHGEVNHYEENKKLAGAIGEWAVQQGRGSGLVFYGGDQNIADRTEDTFFGAPLTSAWDELGVYENTGHGSIDVLASYDGDGRVSARSIRALDDSELLLNMDHFVVEATYLVEPLRAQAGSSAPGQRIIINQEE
jgi:hypothetical protein